MRRRVLPPLLAGGNQPCRRNHDKSRRLVQWRDITHAAAAMLLLKKLALG